MKLNRKWMLVLALVLSVAMATGGTLAYLTDRDTEVNVFTMGNVDIELKEDFEQDSELIPGLDIEKEPTITNVGPNDAWVWATIAIPSALDNDDASANVVHFNMSKDSVAEGKWTWWKKNSRTEWLKQYNVEYDGVNYNVFTVLYQTALKKGDTTEPVIYKVYMDPHVDIAPDGQLHHVENGKVTKLDWNINTNGNPKIYVSAYAMQTNEFADVYAAYEAYTAQWSTSGKAKDVIAWGEDDGETDGGFISIDSFGDDNQAFDNEVSDEIFARLQAGEDVIIAKESDLVGFTENELDAKGATVVINGTGPEAYGYLAFIPENGGDMQLSNLNVTGSGFVEVGHYGMGGGTYTIDNLQIKNLGATLKNADKGFNIGCAFMSFGNATLNDCVIKGTSAIQDDTMAVDLGCGQGLTTNINGGEYGVVYCWSHSTVNIDDAEIKTIYVAPIKGEINIAAGTHIKTMNIDYGTSEKYATEANLAKITIEDGATIDKIVFDGKTYTQAEWLAR